jgi:hypothetical protein
LESIFTAENAKFTEIGVFLVEKYFIPRLPCRRGNIFRFLFTADAEFAEYEVGEGRESRDEGKVGFGFLVSGFEFTNSVLSAFFAVKFSSLLNTSHSSLVTRHPLE